MSGFENDVVFAKNADFTQADNQTVSEANGLATNGQLWIGTTALNAGGTHINVGTITSPGGSVTIGYSSPNITLTAGASVPTTFNANTGSAVPAANILTVIGGTGINTSGSGSTLTINAVGTGMTWSVITAASQAMSVNNGYIANRAGTVAFTLPTTSAVGDMIEVTGINTATGWSIGYTTNQQIFYGTSSATITTGTLASTNIRDSVRLVCVVANLGWNVLSSVGNITVT
jgi:hypothetical protein